MKKYKHLCLIVGLLISTLSYSQTHRDSVDFNKEYSNLDSALVKPENVFRLNLSSQILDTIKIDTIWSQFTNLEYLSLKNDHLKHVPSGLVSLKNLKVLDLSGNDFKLLPEDFSKLSSLQELYLNDDKFFQFEKSIHVLSSLPNLKSLHVENDGLTTIPKNIGQLSHLESLYLNNNKFRQVPIELKGLKSLQYLDLHDNKFELPSQALPNPGFGFKIRF